MVWVCHPLAGVGFACVHLGDCWECGGAALEGERFCSHDCADSYQRNVARMEAARQARRAAEDAWGERAHQLVLAGHSYEEVDRIMAADD